MGALAPQSALLARMKGQRVYIDANFLIYFFDRRAPYFDVIAPLFVACDCGDFAGFTGDAAVAEVMVHPYRSRSVSEIARGKAFFARKNFITVLAHDAGAFDTAAQLRAGSTMKMMDALHYATAVQSGCRFLLTNDGDFVSAGTMEVIAMKALLP